ncbi:hypothetical protein H6F75_08190 [Nodosilinea sp. FACHB-131]|uniref:hypothetical protein n=1 Tax=Cyanophyceae TaxID=3028117 RepID=UPI001688A119|nr:hypothetical protein [Nodosilinea sp. FACHB-131]MBD1873457.1 hypothetical protein [Nodosilinea sp. FACHB-131]
MGPRVSVLVTIPDYVKHQMIIETGTKILSYLGYTITHPSGTLFDRRMGYVATDGNLVHVFVTGVISGSFSDEAAVEAFEPHRETIIQGLRL